MSTQRDDIKLAALHLPVSCSTRMECPFCVSKEQSMLVTRHNDCITYKCFRASCKQGGRIGGSRGDIGTPIEAKSTFVPQYFTEPTRGLPTSVSKFLLDKYNLEFLPGECRYCPESERLYLPVLSSAGEEVGAVVKQLVRGRQPKAVLYKYMDVPTLHYVPHSKQDGPVLICEDILSSYRLAPYGRARALLGTNLYVDTAIALSKEKGPFRLVLDSSDAIPIMVKLRKDFGGLFSFDIVVLSADPKDCSEDELVSKFNLWSNAKSDF